jgi:preprotein translocase subunit YajC
MGEFLSGAWFSSLSLLADAGLADAAAPPPAGNPNPAAGILQFLPFIAIAVLFYFLLIRPQKREQQARQDLLKTLKKNDRVVTIGGIIGTVANLTPDGKEVTLKVDDNTKLRMLRSSIQSILTSEGTPEPPSLP